MATVGGIHTDILQPNDWRVQLGQGQGLDGLGWTSYAMQQGNASMPANPAYFKADVPGNTGLILVDAKNSTVYSYHPNFYPQAPQQGTISSLGLDPVYMQALEFHVRGKLMAAGLDPDAALAAKPLGDWLLLVIGLTILALGLVLSSGVLISLLPEVYMMISLAAFGPLLVYTGVGLTILGSLDYAFSPTTTQTGPNSWQNCDILGCTACANNSGSVSCQPASPSAGVDLIQVAEGVAAIAVVGVGGYVAYKVVKGHYDKKAYSAPYPNPPRGPAFPRPVTA